MDTKPRCKNLVLDAGPLLSLSPLRGLAETYLTVPQVLSELKDNRAREHFERLGLNAGVRIEVRNPDAASLSHVIQFAKKTGDYSVLSHADLCILALTYSLHKKAKADEETQQSAVDSAAQTEAPAADKTTSESIKITAPEEEESVPQSTTEDPAALYQQDSTPEEAVDEADLEPLDVELHRETPETSGPPSDTTTSQTGPEETSGPLYDDPSDSDDGEGEWITPGNVSIYKSRALDLLPSEGGKSKKNGREETVTAGCMTADFAMQNVILQMDMNLVGTEGKRIERVKSWVLRCHACFKICKDNSKKFCPSCGNPTLLRASVTISSPNASSSAPVMQIHLKPNFQYKTRGTKYSIPAPKSGSAKTGPGEGLILREDQAEYQRAKKRADGKRAKEEQRMLKGVFDRGGEGGVKGSWMDPDWMPEIMSVGSGGKGRSMRSGGMDGDMPVIGHGRKNPNERRRKA